VFENVKSCGKSEKNLEKCIETVKSCIETVENIGLFFTPPAHLIEIPTNRGLHGFR
jgi:hypothetical protein